MPMSHWLRTGRVVFGSAYDEADANWGKDYGFLVKDRGVPLYVSRRIRLLRLGREVGGAGDSA